MIRYGSETRMYILVVFLSLAFGLVLARAWEKPTLGRWVAVTAVTAALAYTHYWTLLLIGAVAIFPAASDPAPAAVSSALLARAAGDGGRDHPVRTLDPDLPLPDAAHRYALGAACAC